MIIFQKLNVKYHILKISEYFFINIFSVNFENFLYDLSTKSISKKEKDDKFEYKLEKYFNLCQFFYRQKKYLSTFQFKYFFLYQMISNEKAIKNK